MPVFKCNSIIPNLLKKYFKVKSNNCFYLLYFITLLIFFLHIFISRFTHLLYHTIILRNIQLMYLMSIDCNPKFKRVIFIYKFANSLKKFISRIYLTIYMIYLNLL